jgi:phytoene dehydrogenase-like protein
MSSPDAIVIGAGPNGLVAANVLADAGFSVLVLESNRRPGGAVWTESFTQPGFLHDVGAAFFPFGQTSPALRPLDLSAHGLVWKHAPFDSAHPSIDGTCAAIGRDLEASKRNLGVDGPAWEKLATWHARTRDELLGALLSTLPAVKQLLRFGIPNLLRLALVASSSGRTFAERQFKTDAARRIIPALALHTDVGPDDPFGAIVGFMLTMLASSGGFAIPEGGAASITKALLARLASRGGTVLLGKRVRRIVVREGRASAVLTEDGVEYEARRAIIADTSAPALYLKLLDPAFVPAPIADSMRRFPYGFGTFKMDWALDGPVPWIAEDACDAAVVHTGDNVDDLARFTAQVRRGELPERPYLVIGQQSIADPTRAPAGKHTLWAYSRVPSNIDGGWKANAERFADRIDDRIEELAPGFKKRVLGRFIVTPPDLEAMDENLVGGDLGGGSAQIQHQLFFRPVFPYFRYRTPIRGLYLGSSYTHPGAGVHGACGFNAAQAAIEDTAD